MKLTQLFFIMLSVSFLIGCSEDDNLKKENKFLTYDGKNYPLDKIIYNDEQFDNDNLINITFTSTEAGLIFSVLLSSDWDGKTVELTELNRRKEWVVSLTLYDEENSYFSYNGDYTKIEEGTLFIKAIDAENGKFDIKINFTSEGKKIRLNYNGELEPASLR